MQKQEVLCTILNTVKLTDNFSVFICRHNDKLFNISDINIHNKYDKIYVTVSRTLNTKTKNFCEELLNYSPTICL
jgi:hypothetical protein